MILNSCSCSSTQVLGTTGLCVPSPAHSLLFHAADGWTLYMLVQHSTTEHISRATFWPRTNTVHPSASVHRSPRSVCPFPPGSCCRGSGGMLSPARRRLTHPVTPCTRRQPDRGRVSRGGVPAGAGPGQQPSAAGVPALHFSTPTARTPVRSGWTQQREDSLSELPGCRGKRIHF